MRWAHPLRTPLLWPITLAMSVLWCVAACFTLWRGFPAHPLVQAVLLAAGAYGISLTLFRSRSG